MAVEKSLPTIMKVALPVAALGGIAIISAGWGALGGWGMKARGYIPRPGVPCRHCGKIFKKKK